MTVRISQGDIGTLHVRFDYSDERVKKIKTIKNAQWNPAKKCRIIHNTTANIQCIQKPFSNDELIIDIETMKNDLQNNMDINSIDKRIDECTGNHDDPDNFGAEKIKMNDNNNIGFSEDIRYRGKSHFV